ncbi:MULTISPECIES: PAS domain S-box protein [unclassified Flavobacterium]|uniref:PAS domain S-box protein n=1 Tax=unclassified Flavobacterium TaxID=196869 RepID=UPI00131BD53D|nr:MULTISPECIES: PAS domain S-box protein [unclassified Flavobacterium]
MLLKRKNIKLLRWFIVRPKTSGVLSFLFVSIITILISLQQYKLVKELEQREMNNILNVVHHNIEESLKNYYTATLTLALTLNDEGIPKDFEYVSKRLIESNKSIYGVQIVPNGVIKYIYPFAENRPALNLNILTNPYLKKEAFKSIADKKIYFAGPLQLKQGGIGIIGRYPIYRNNTFWGFSAVVIKLNTFLVISGIKNIDNSKYYFQFSKFDSNKKTETFYLNTPTSLKDKYYISAKIADGDWNLYLISKNNSHLYSAILIPCILGFIFAAILGLLVTTLLKIPNELQSLVKLQANKLLDTEIKFKTIFDQAALGIASVDPITGNFLEINTKFCEMLGYTQKEMKLKKFQSVTHPDDLEKDMKNVDHLKNGRISEYTMQKRYFTKNGEIIWVNLTVTPLLDTNKNQQNVIAIVEDITLKKNTEKLIKKSETRFKSLFDDSPLPLREEDFSAVKKYLEQKNLIYKTPETVLNYFEENPQDADECHSLIKVLSANKACLKLYKVKNIKELIQNKNELFSLKSRNDFVNNLVAITQGKKQFIIDTQIKTVKGEYRDINLRWNLVQGYRKTFERVIVSTEDITNRLASERIILETKQRVESLINTIDGIVWECDATTFNFGFISKKVINILGYTPDEWISDPHFWSKHIYHEDKEWVLTYCKIKVEENLDHDFEYRMIAKDGKTVWLRDIINIIYDSGKPAMLRGIMIDITRSKEYENELNTSFEIVSEQNKRLLNFSYIVSHNLRSHTSNIASIVSFLETTDSEEEKNEMLQLLKTVSNSLGETMLHLNEVINIRTNIDLLLESLNLNEYISTALNVLSEQITKNDISIINQVPLDTIVNYNPAYLESILFNIISNSIRYRHSDRKTIITISYQMENNLNFLLISDNGIGIDLAKNEDKIFGMYKTFTSNSESKGIGLFITKNQIDAMGGSISVNSEPNIGTTFKIFIR